MESKIFLIYNSQKVDEAPIIRGQGLGLFDRHQIEKCLKKIA
jgi:hypothetical protein